MTKIIFKSQLRYNTPIKGGLNRHGYVKNMKYVLCVAVGVLQFELKSYRTCFFT